MKVASNVGAAQAAVSGFASGSLSGKGQQVSLASSNVSSMQAGVTVANDVLSCISALVSGVKAQAGNVSALAAEIEDRDKQDAGGWCEAK